MLGFRTTRAFIGRPSNRRVSAQHFSLQNFKIQLNNVHFVVLLNPILYFVSVSSLQRKCVQKPLSLNSFYEMDVNYVYALTKYHLTECTNVMDVIVYRFH